MSEWNYETTPAEIKEKVLKIVDLALQINDRPTRQELTENKPTVFVSFFGHTNTLCVDCNPDGYAEKAPTTQFCAVKLTDKSTGRFWEGESKIPVSEKLDETIQNLERILKEIKQWEV